jgi:hypothetical protein
MALAIRVEASRSAHPIVFGLGWGFRNGVPYWIDMAQPHPHADATYHVVRRADLSFVAEVNIPGQYPITITGFATEAAAEAWIIKHKREVEDYRPSWRGRRKPKPW